MTVGNKTLDQIANEVAATEIDSWQKKAVVKTKSQLKALCAKLSSANVTAVEVDMDGYGDEGQVTETRYFKGEEEVFQKDSTSIDELPITVQYPDGRDPQTSKVGDIVDEFAYSAMDTANFDGWQDGIGSYSEIKIDVATRTATVSYREREEVLKDPVDVKIVDDLEDFCKEEEGSAS